MTRLLPIALLLAGCAAPRTDPAAEAAWQAEAVRDVPTCRSQLECGGKWAAAREFVLTHSPWKIRQQTADFLETFGSPTGSSSLGWRVTLRPLSDGSSRIEASASCGTTYTPCNPPAWLAVRDFGRHVNASWRQP